MSRRVLVHLIAFVSLLSAASSGDDRRSQKNGRAGTVQKTDATPESGPVPKDVLMAAADEIVRQVAALRGLRPKGPLSRGVLTRQQVGEKLRERIAKEYTPEEV